MRELSRAAREAGRVYFTGGATAVLLGWRESTIDIDIKLVPEADAILRAVPALKELLELNVELAAPDDFVPVQEDWPDRSPFVAQEGLLSFHHFDLYAQALAKIERGHAVDRLDVQELLARGLVERARLAAYFEAVRDRLYRYPAIDPARFRVAVEEAVRFPIP